MTAPDAQTPGAGASDATLLAQAIAANAGRMGLTWQRRMATVVGGSNSAAVTAKLDGDTQAVAMVSMIGPLATGQRVYVDAVPPSGLFITGYAYPLLSGPTNVKIINNTGGADTTTSATFETIDNVGAPFSFTKYGAAETSLEVSLHLSTFTNIAVTTLAAGVRIDGTDTQIFAMLFNVASSHTGLSGVVKAVVATAGVKSITPVWKRTAGTGTFTRDANDYLSMAVREVLAG